MPCGPASGVMWLDIDSDNLEVLRLCPTSPVRKKGKTGESRAFRYNPEITLKTIGSKGRGGEKNFIEILSVGRYNVLPYSIHPETKMPYQYLTLDCFPDFPVKDLPLLTLESLRPVMEFYSEAVSGPLNYSLVAPLEVLTNTDRDRESPHGAHNQLRQVAAALIFKGSSIDEAVEELLRVDQKY